MDDDVCTRQALLDRVGGCKSDLLRALESDGAGNAESKVDEVVGAGPPHADAVDSHDAINGFEVMDEVASG